MIPTIIDCGVKLLVSLVQALPDIIYAIVAVLPTIIASIVSTLLGMIPTIIQCGIDLLVSLVKALPEIIIAIVAVIPQIISSIIQALVDSIPLIIQAGVDLFMSLITNLPKIIIELVKAVPQIISALVDALGDGVAKFSEIGGNLIKGLWKGIKNVKDWLWGKIKGFFNGIVDGIKEFFGIHSPSKLFENVIGKNLMLGLADGITENGDVAVDAAMDVAEGLAAVDFDLNKPELDTDGIDYDGIIARAKATVEFEAKTSGTISTAAENIYARYNETDAKIDEEDADKKTRYVQNDIYVDGKKAARVLTPYIAKELEWEDK